MRKRNHKKPAAVLAALALTTALLAGCGSTAATTESTAESTAASESEAVSSEETADEGDADEVAAKNCADLIDAIYVQERTDDTAARRAPHAGPGPHNLRVKENCHEDAQSGKDHLCQPFCQ